MPTAVTISDEAKARADELVEQGHFDSVQQVVDTAMGHLAYDYGYRNDEDDDEIDPDAEANALVGVSDEDREAIREGLRDAKQGRLLTSDEVFEPLLARIHAMGAERSAAGGR